MAHALRPTRLTGRGLALATAGGATVVAGAVGRFGTGWVPPCPLHALTGLDCPGCGSTRAIEALVHLDVPAAVGYNAFVVLLALPALLWAWTRTMGDRPAPPIFTAAAPTRWLAVVAVAFTVARNLPLPALSSLAA